MTHVAIMPLAEAEKLEDVCKALDSGRLYVAMSSGRWWRLRRNGKTRLWKKDPSRWEIPVKYGLKGYATINQHWKLGEEYDYKENIPFPMRSA